MLSPFNAGVYVHSDDGKVGIEGDLETCARAIRALPKDPVTGREVEYWPCVGISNTGGAKGGSQETMLKLFASPERFIADAVNYSKATLTQHHPMMSL